MSRSKWKYIFFLKKKLKIEGECNKEPINIFKMWGNVNLKEPIGGNVMWNFQM